jgi:hypothetical protein
MRESSLKIGGFSEPLDSYQMQSQIAGGNDIWKETLVLSRWVNVDKKVEEL